MSFTFSPKKGRALTLPLRASTLLLNALETAGALDDVRPPRAPKSGGAAARAKWLATPSKQPDKLPSYKLSSNAGWIVSPAECRVVARALENLLADEESLELLRDILDAPRSSDEAMRAQLKEFAVFNARAAKSGGYTVD